MTNNDYTHNIIYWPSWETRWAFLAMEINAVDKPH